MLSLPSKGTWDIDKSRIVWYNGIMLLEETMILVEDARRGAGLTVKQLCKKAGISVPTYNNYRSKRTKPTIETLSMILDALGVQKPTTESTEFVVPKIKIKYSTEG